jgi:hypothetical protein
MKRQLFIHSRKIAGTRTHRKSDLVSKSYPVIITVCIGYLMLLVPAFADRLVLNDGTIIEGKIEAETIDDIRVVTRHGDFTFQKSDLSGIQRDSAKTVPTTNTAPALNLLKYIPPGPVDPLNPPGIQPLLQFAPPRPTAPLAASTSASAALRTPAQPAPNQSPAPR